MTWYMAEKNMSRILPLICSGSNKLVISETICFNPLDGLLIEIPTTSKQTSDKIFFNFNFPFQAGEEKGKIETNIVDHRINITVHNFGNTFLSGLTTPLTFKIGNLSISLFFTGMLLTNRSHEEKKLLQFTFSIFSGEVK